MALGAKSDVDTHSEAGTYVIGECGLLGHAFSNTRKILIFYVQNHDNEWPQQTSHAGRTISAAGRPQNIGFCQI